MATRRRTKGREVALQFLFSADLREDQPDAAPFVRELCRKVSGKDDVYAFAMSIIEGCQQNLEAIDQQIQQAAANWSLERLAGVDRNILRIGAYELMYCKDTPTQVVLNEAIELAKKFSTRESGKFVNGILDRILKDAQLEQGE